MMVGVLPEWSEKEVLLVCLLRGPIPLQFPLLAHISQICQAVVHQTVWLCSGPSVNLNGLLHSAAGRVGRDWEVW